MDEPSKSEALVSAVDLADQLGQSDLVIVDCRFDLLNPAAGLQDWREGHIAGAYYADLDTDLASARQPGSGRHPLPDPQQFAVLLGSWGVGPDTRVVAYDTSGGAVAARLWWLLRWVGHRNVALLDGGLPAWLDEKQTLESDIPELHSGAQYPVKPGCMPVINAGEVAAGLDEGSLMLLDARDEARFAGRVEPIDAQAGHIPGAFNRPFQKNLDATGRFRAPPDLRDSFKRIRCKADRVASMCGSGVTACHNLFAMGLAGLASDDSGWPALYVGSWSEWIASDERSVVTEHSVH